MNGAYYMNGLNLDYKWLWKEFIRLTKKYDRSKVLACWHTVVEFAPFVRSVFDGKTSVSRIGDSDFRKVVS
jgi:hypothetical protein